MARAFYRGYVTDANRAGQVKRLHLMREDGNFAGRQGFCGVQGWDVTKSQTVVLDPMPDRPPTGLLWCPACVGGLADRLGLLPTVAFDLAGVAS